MAKGETEPALCFRHPTKTAKRRCYHCKRPICPACQHRLEGHIFCSTRCAGAERRAEAWRMLGQWNQRALSGAWFRVVLFTGLLVLGAAVLWFSAHVDRFLPVPVTPFPAFHKAHERNLDRETIDWDTPGPLHIDSPASGSVLHSNRITVEGMAPKEAMVGLYVNGGKVAVQLARDGHWSFTEIPVTGRRSVIQARYFDNYGASAYGPAVWVDLRTRPAPLATAAAPPSAPLPVDGLSLSRDAPGLRRVFLTFDGGSNANSTEAILDTLRKEKVHATIFLTGQYMRKYPGLVKRMVAEGHLVGNHTFSHPHLTSYSFNERQNTLKGVTRTFLTDQLNRVAAVFRLITGEEISPYWRAPFGEFNRQILRWSAEDGYRHVYWSRHLDTLDWVSDPADPLFHDPREILRKVTRQANRVPYGVDGGVILMHLGSERRESDRLDTVLGKMIDALKARRYTFATVGESTWGKYGKAPGKGDPPG